MLDFLSLRVYDILDILLVAFLIFLIYRLIKGTVAFNIVVGFLLVYLVYVIVRALHMELLTTIIGQFIGVGVLALIIIFHPEIRRFLLYIGSHYQINRFLSLEKLLYTGKENAGGAYIPELVDTLLYFSRTLTGAIIVIARRSELVEQISTGDIIDARLSQPLLKTIFFKNSALHDGAVIISEGRIAAAGCILPLTHKEVDKSMGLRHRAAIGISETTDAIVLVVSEETGHISLVEGGNIERHLSMEKLTELLFQKLVPATQAGQKTA